MLPPSSSFEEITAKKVKYIWDPEVFSFSNKSSPLAAECLAIRRRCVLDDPLSFLNTEFLNKWKLDDLIKAAKLLRRPVIATKFENEHEMRRVYSMIYDVFRCKFYELFQLYESPFYLSFFKINTSSTRHWKIYRSSSIIQMYGKCSLSLELKI